MEEIAPSLKPCCKDLEDCSYIYPLEFKDEKIGHTYAVIEVVDGFEVIPIKYCPFCGVEIKPA